MTANFQLHYVSLQYSSGKTLLSLTASHFPLSVTSDGTKFTAKAVIYPDVAGKPAQLGVSSACRPQICRPDGTLVPMRRVVKPCSNEAYWIEDGSWEESYKNYTAETRNKPGLFKFECDDQQCEVDISVESRPFSEAEYLSLLDDFQQSLFGLVVDPQGSVSHVSSKQVPIFSREVEQLFRDFIKYATQITDAPTHELRETQELRRPSRVKPVRRTFMEIACKGMPDKLTSRAHQASYNTPENRYVAALVNRVHRVVKNATKMLEGRQRTLERAHQRNRDRIIEIDRIEADGWQYVIDQDQMDYELQEAQRQSEAWQQRQLEEWEQQVNRIIKAQPVREKAPVKNLRIKTVFAPPKKIQNEEGMHIKIKCRLQTKTDFEDQSFNLYIPAHLWFPGLFDDKMEYDITVDYDYKGSEHVLSVKFLSSVVIVDTQLFRRDTPHFQLVAKLKTLRTKLKSTGWKQPMTAKMIHDLKAERQVLENRTLSDTSSPLDSHIHNLGALERQLTSLQKRQKSLGIKQDAHFPGSIIFVQNPLYSGLKSSYGQLLVKGEINEDLMEQITGLDALGIIDLPTIYEKWCMVKFMDCIIRDCNFIPQNKNWVDEIVFTASGKRGRFECEFKHEHLPYCIRFSYQEARRNYAFNENQTRTFVPDFVFQFSHQEQNIWTDFATLVCDAKCKNFALNKPTALADDAWNIDKKYRRTPQDFIFVVHPAQGAIKRPRTSLLQVWGQSSFYGGSWPPDWKFLTDGGREERTRWVDQQTPNHRLGAILLKPLSQESIADTDNFRRLVLMLLEYGSQHKEPLFCCACGSTDLKKEQQYAGHKLTCRDCGEFAIYTHCNNLQCSMGTLGKHANLYKHGTYWTFHDFHPTAPYNIRCPQCGSTL